MYLLIFNSKSFLVEALENTSFCIQKDIILFLKLKIKFDFAYKRILLYIYIYDVSYSEITPYLSLRLYDFHNTIYN